MLKEIGGKLLNKIPHRIINGECSETLGPLLTRYYIKGGPNPDGGWEGQKRTFHIYLHHLHRSDHRIPHDHPWDFWSFILKGSYTEWSPMDVHFYKSGQLMSLTTIINQTGEARVFESCRKYNRFSLLRRKANWIHRLEMVKPCWTLVITFKKRRSWGFWEFFNNTLQFTNWKDYKYSGPCEGE